MPGLSRWGLALYGGPQRWFCCCCYFLGSIFQSYDAKWFSYAITTVASEGIARTVIHLHLDVCSLISVFPRFGHQFFWLLYSAQNDTDFNVLWMFQLKKELLFMTLGVGAACTAYCLLTLSIQVRLRKIRVLRCLSYKLIASFKSKFWSTMPNSSTFIWTVCSYICLLCISSRNCQIWLLLL